MNIFKNNTIEKRWEYIFPLLFSFSLALSCIIISQKKFLWLDELYSFYLINDQEFTHMMSALSDKINNAPPLYFILGWFWSKLFTSTELSLRLFSCLGICFAQAIVWLILRRTYDFWSSSLATIGIFGVSGMILEQNAEYRFYGLFVAVCSLGLLQFDSLCRKEQHSQGLIFSNTFVHVAIIQTHLYGFIYSGIILLALIIRDRYFEIFRPKVYLSVVLAWFSIIPFIPSLLNQADQLKPRGWIPVPSIYTLISYYRNISPSLFIISLVIPALLFINKNYYNKQYNDNNRDFEGYHQNVIQNSVAEVSLLILAFSLLAVPIVSWLISRSFQPIFLDRYMIPTQIGWIFLLAFLISRIVFPNLILRKKKSGRFNFFQAFNKQRLVLITLTLILAVNPIYYAIKVFPPQQLPGSNDNRYGYVELPIAVESTLTFLPRFHYSPERNRYFYISDWQVALDKKSGLSSTGEYKAMDALKRNYLNVFNKNIIQGKDFLNKYGSFLVLHNEENCTSQDSLCYKWFDIKVKNDPKYTVKKLGDIENKNKLFLVETK